MKRNDIADDLEDGFELAPMPPVSQDGRPLLPVVRPPMPDRPRLCEQGPCQNYHRFSAQMDTRPPMPLSLPPSVLGDPVGDSGAAYVAPAPYHVETHHYCYPTVGVETRLGPLPVVECNRWVPRSIDDDDDYRRDAFLGSAAGRKFQQEIAEWEAARKAEADEFAALEASLQATNITKDHP